MIMAVDYAHYAERVFSQAAYSPEVNHHNMQEIIEYSDEIAKLLLIDEDELRSEVIRLVRLNIIQNF